MNIKQFSYSQIKPGHYVAHLYSGADFTGIHPVCATIYFENDPTVRQAFDQVAMYLRDRKEISLRRFRQIMDPCRVDISDLEGVAE